MNKLTRWTVTLAWSGLLLIALAACSNSKQPAATVSVNLSPTATAVPNTPTPTEEATPSPSATALPAQPTETPLPTATPTPLPQPTPTPQPTATAVPILQPAWLSYLNLFRSMAQLPPLSEREALSLGARLHSEYMVVNDDPIAHLEEPDNALYSQEGDHAAKNSNIFATSQFEANYNWSINFWASAPFHLIPIIDPELGTAGFGQFNQEVGAYQMAAVLDVLSDLGEGTAVVTYPIYFPADGSETWILRQSLYEWPEPFGNCPGYALPAGPAFVLQLGDGSLTPNVTSHAFYRDDVPLDSCVFDETNYLNSNAYAQRVGRTILDQRDAIVVIPRNQLAVDETYTVQVVANGQAYTWSFHTRKRAPDTSP